MKVNTSLNSHRGKYTKHKAPKKGVNSREVMNSIEDADIDITRIEDLQHWYNQKRISPVMPNG